MQGRKQAKPPRRVRIWRAGLTPALLGVAFIATLLLLRAELTAQAPSQETETDFFLPVTQEISTHLYQIQTLDVWLERFADKGGAIEPLGNRLLLATPRGRLAVIDADGTFGYLEQRVLMYATPPEQPSTWVGFRVADILLKEDAPGAYTLFVSHHYHAGDCVEIRISSISLTLKNDTSPLLGDWRTVFTAVPCIKTDLFYSWEGEDPKFGGGIQVGGKLLLDGEDHLLFAIGDNAWYEWQVLQTTGNWLRAPVVDPNTQLGKVVRVALASGEARTVATGFRNPQGFARDKVGNIWLTEHGPLGGDELNLVKPELDFGWPHVTYGVLYGNRIWPFNEVQGDHSGFEEPVYSWIPSIGVSSVIAVDSRDLPLWQGDLLIASLRANSLFRVRLRQERVVYFERIPIGERIRDIAQMADGRIALLMDSSKVIFVWRAPLYCQADYRSVSVYTHDAQEVCIDLLSVFDSAESPGIHSIQGMAASRPHMSSNFDIYLRNRRIFYLKNPCSEEDLRDRFFLHITPENLEELSDDHRGLGFGVYDFNATDEGVATAASDQKCVVTRALPPFAIRSLNTGQVRREESADGEIRWIGPLWESSQLFDKDGRKETKAVAAGTSPAGDPSDHPGAPLYAAQCAGCHNLTEQHSLGPHLHGIMGRRAGAVAGFNTTVALREIEVYWTPENLAQFIADPAGFAPGADKGNLGLTEEEARLIADFLASQQ